MNVRVYGDTANLKASHVHALERLGERTVPADSVVSAPLARDLVGLGLELNRRIGLFIDRRGRVTRVILGSAHSLALPEFDRVRGVAGRLRGIRLVLSHLTDEPLNREELADLSKLRLDLIASVHQGPAGLALDVATLRPAKTDAIAPHVWPRAPLADVLRDETDGTADGTTRLGPLQTFLRELEAALVAQTTRARAERKGVAALAMLVHQGGPETTARRHELRELCRTAGIDLIDLVEQRRPYPDPHTFFGAGKLQDVLTQALEHDAELLICDPELSAAQARTVAKLTDLKVIDRTMLILDIFAKHAKSADGKLQVELAQLRYNLPKMMGKGTMMSRLAGGIGGQGPGETKLEIDRRRANDRIRDLEKRLERLHKQREQKRALRKRHGVPVVAIVGYTNAGKSTLLNTVTGSDVDAENKLFATLDPTVRRIRFPLDREIVLLDTVGFIRHLPPALTQAFSATLEEVRDADLLLHVVDATDPHHDEQIETVSKILTDLEAGTVPRFMVMNKAEELSPAEQRALRTSVAHLGPAFTISALDRRACKGLMNAVETFLCEQGKFERPSAPAELQHEVESESDTARDWMNPQ